MKRFSIVAPVSSGTPRIVASRSSRRGLAPIVLGSIALHALLLWAAMRFPSAPTSPAPPERLLEVQLQALPDAPKKAAKIEIAPRRKSVPAPQSSRRVAIKPAPRSEVRVRPKTQIAPRPQPQATEVPVPVVTLPPVPLVRTTPLIAKSVVQKSKVPALKTSPVVPPVTPHATSAPQKIKSNIIPKSPPAIPSKVAKNSDAPDAQGVGTGTGSGTGSGKGSGSGSGNGTGTGSGKGSGSGSGTGFGTGSGNGSGTGAGEGAGSGQGKGNGQGDGTGNGSGAGNGDGGGSGGGGGGGGGGNSGGGGSGGPFGIGGGAGEGPRHIVYVLDISRSMEPRIERARRELSDALAGLQPQESFNIVAFYGRFQLFKQKLLDVNPQNIAQAGAFLDSLRLDNGTNLERAMEKALGTRGVNVVVVITDGVPTYGEQDFDKLARRVRQLNKSKARIFTVGLVGKDPEGIDQTFEATRLLQQIAKESGGEFRLASVDEFDKK
ncbi:VWA domain-containing protein [Abditibacterium utsteinense]|nr:VWA domain-containing protein [Abditibacterium utsteinense]